MKPSFFTLRDNAIHAWYVDLLMIIGSQECLSDDEQARAARFHFDKDRQQFTAAHIALRNLLGLYLQIEPQHLKFQVGQYGKPALAGDNPPLQFNLSHAGTMALLAVTRKYAVGADIELIRPMPDLEDIARHFFSAAEVADLDQLPQSEKQRAFFDCWTRKEAFIKALGSGLSHPLDSFSVPLEAHTMSAQLELESRWSLWAFTPAPDYTAAVVADTRAPMDIKIRAYPPASADS